jgi:hypothetical protein
MAEAKHCSKTRTSPTVAGAAWKRKRVHRAEDPNPGSLTAGDDWIGGREPGPLCPRERGREAGAAKTIRQGAAMRSPYRVGRAPMSAPIRCVVFRPEPVSTTTVVSAG